MDPAMIELARGFGIAAPLVAALMYLLYQAEKREERASSERRETQGRHLDTLTTVVADNRLAQERHTGSLERHTSALAELTTTIREDRAHAREEHRAILDAIGKAVINPHKEP